MSPFDRMPPENEKMNMRFSETHEVVLSIGTLQFMLDLDAGETCPAPARNSDYLSKFEIHPTQDQPQEEPRGLTFPSLEATTLRLDTLSVAPEIWNLPDAEVFSALATTKPTPTQAMDGWGRRLPLARRSTPSPMIPTRRCRPGRPAPIRGPRTTCAKWNAAPMSWSTHRRHSLRRSR